MQKIRAILALLTLVSVAACSSQSITGPTDTQRETSLSGLGSGNAASYSLSGLGSGN